MRTDPPHNADMEQLRCKNCRRLYWPNGWELDGFCEPQCETEWEQQGDEE